MVCTGGVERHGRSLLIDAMSALGAIPLDAREVPFDAVVASSNKCLEGVPGMGFAIIREQALARRRCISPIWRCRIPRTASRPESASGSSTMAARSALPSAAAK